MKVTPLLIALACVALLPQALAQTTPAKPAAKPAARPAAAVPAAAKAPEDKTLALGGGSAAGKGGPLMTRDELRVCLKDEETVRTRMADHDALRAPLDQEKKDITTAQADLRQEREPIDALKVRADAFAAKIKDYSARVQSWNDRMKLHNEDPKPSGAAFEGKKLALNKEREDIEKERVALEAERAAITAVASGDSVRAYNAKAVALDARVTSWNERNNKWNDAIAALDVDRKAWLAACADRRYREDDEIAIRRGK